MERTLKETLFKFLELEKRKLKPENQGFFKKRELNKKIKACRAELVILGEDGNNMTICLAEEMQRLIISEEEKQLRKIRMKTILAKNKERYSAKKKLLQCAEENMFATISDKQKT